MKDRWNSKRQCWENPEHERFETKAWRWVLLSLVASMIVIGLIEGCM